MAQTTEEVPETTMASLENDDPLPTTEILNVIVSSVGIVANAFAILVLLGYKKLRKRIGNWLLVNQSILDLLASCVMWAYSMNNIVTKGSMEAPDSGIAGELYCGVWASGLLQWGLAGASAYNLIGITYERYMMVVRPLYHKVSMTERRIAIICTIPLVFSFVYSVPFFVLTTSLEGNTCIVVEMSSNATANHLSGVMELIVWIVIPISSMSFMYLRMVGTLRSKVGPQPVAVGPTAQGGHNLSRAQRNLTKTCIIVVIVFVCLWCPNQIVLQLFIYEANISPLDAYHAGLVMVNLNGCINPFIYALSYADFRRGIRNLFGYRVETSGTSASLTRAK